MKSIEYYNNLYLLGRKEEEAELLKDSSLDIENIKSDPEWMTDIFYSFEKYLKLKLSKPLYFTFGKYKGRIVQDIIEKDKEYCDWFADNIVSNNQEILVIIDLINKIGERYTVSNPIQELKNIFKNDLEIELKEDDNKYITKLFFNLYSKYKSGGYSDYSGYSDYVGKDEFDFYGYWDDYPEYY